VGKRRLNSLKYNKWKNSSPRHILISMIKNSVNLKVFGLLLGLSLLSVAAVFPYLVTIQGELLSSTGLPLAVIFLTQLLQSGILFAVAIYLGLLCTKKIGFGLPLIEAFLEKKQPLRVLARFGKIAVISGVLTASAIFLLDILFSKLGVTLSTHQTYAPIWQTLLAAFYGGIAEEVLMRLFLMTLFIWISLKVSRSEKPTSLGIWVAVVLAALIFGIGHLPVTASLTQLTALVIFRALVLNGIGGIVFGWLFWKKGFESAVIAHFTTDVVLLTILPLLLS